MTARPMAPELLTTIRAAISTAYYDARNDGKTMEHAADQAAEAIVPTIASIDANAHARGAVEALETLTAKIREVSKGEVGTWGLVAMVHEMAAEVSASYGARS